MAPQIDDKDAIKMMLDYYEKEFPVIDRATWVTSLLRAHAEILGLVKHAFACGVESVRVK